MKLHSVLNAGLNRQFIKLKMNTQLIWFATLSVLLGAPWVLYFNTNYFSAVQKCSMTTEVKEHFVRESLYESERVWSEGVERRKQNFINWESLTTNPWAQTYMSSVLDYHYPNFNCPHIVQRFGGIGSDSKWICGWDQVRSRGNDCTIYSIGTAKDKAFREEMAAKSSCTLRVINSVIQANSTIPLLKYYPHLNASSFTMGGMGFYWTVIGLERSIREEMEIHGDKFIDILHVDVNGAEVNLLTQFAKDFPISLPVGQLLLQVHLVVLTQERLYRQLKTWMETLELAGLRLFRAEPNVNGLYYGANDPAYYDLSFLNIKTDHAVLHA